jgi:DnaJ-class molecular chaperone
MTTTRKCPKCDGKGSWPKTPQPGDPMHHGPREICVWCNGSGSLVVPDGWDKIEADDDRPTQPGDAAAAHE